MPAVRRRSQNLRVGDGLKTLSGVLLIDRESEVLQPKTKDKKERSR